MLLILAFSNFQRKIIITTMAAPMHLGSKPTKLKTCEEVVFIAIQGVEDQTLNVGAWDLRTGNLLQSFRHGSAAPHSLCLLANESLMAASLTKPVIHMWNLHCQNQKHRKLICGKKISCLASTPDSNYLAAGLEDKIHLWQVCTGELYSVLSHSSVEVKCLKFSPSGEFLISGYKDGTVAVWELQECLQQDQMRIKDHSPVGTFTSHSGEITGLHVTLSNKVVSCATDFTVKIWDLLSLEEFRMFELGAPVCSVVVDHSELTLYAGDQHGKIYCIDLNYQPSDKAVHLGSQEEMAFTSYSAHLGPVLHMCLSSDQSKLVTASDDHLVKIWSLMSPVSPLVITVNDKVSNLLVVPTPPALVTPDHKPQLVVSNLSRQLHGSDDADKDIEVSIQIHPGCKVHPFQHQSNAMPSKDLESLIQRADELKKANSEIYQFALREIIK